MKKLNKGIGIWQIINSSMVTDIIASAGIDITILDLEHGLHTPETIQNCIYAANSSSNLLTIARIPSHDYQYIVQIIDTGIDGILFPHVETKEQLDKIINLTFLYPFGKKSYSPFVSKYKYGLDQDNKNNPLLGILIESKLGMKNLDSLLSNPKVDFIYFGAYDLSMEINKNGNIFDPVIIENLKDLISSAKRFNKKIFAIYRNDNELKILFKLGVDYPIASVDTSNLIKKLKDENSKYLELISKLDS